MEKRGISGVVTTMLIMLIAIVAISIVWVFVQPAILNIFGGGDGKGGFNKFITCTDLELVAESCSYTDTEVKIHVKRGIGSQNIEKLGFQFSSGNSFILSSDNSISGSIPNEFGSSIFVFDRNDFSQAPFNVRVTGLLDSGACQFDDIPVQCNSESPQDYECGNGILEPGEQCDDGNDDNEDACDNQCRIREEELSSCDNIYGVVNLSDFESECTRIINGYLSSDIRPLPKLGFHNAGPTNLAGTANIGAKIHRTIVSWHQAYNPDGSPRELMTETERNNYSIAGIGLVLTIRTNHPDKSTCAFDTNLPGIEQKDSYPKNETEWKEYVKAIVNEYYVLPIQNGQQPLVLGIQLGNEWSHQFAVNTTSNPGCSVSATPTDAKINNMTSLMRITKEAMEEAQLGLGNEKKMPLLTFGLTGLDNFAMHEGYSYNDSLYNGYFSGGITIVNPEDVNPVLVSDTRRFIIESSPYYDYLDVHVRSNYFYDQGYIAQWIRQMWKDNGITGKGISSTEYAGPFNFYTTDYHEYYIPTSLANSLYQGYDSILWAPFNPEKSGSINVNYGLPGLKDWNNQDRQYAFDGYRRIGLIPAFEKINFAGDTYIFYSNDVEIGRINTSENIPLIPDTYEQCNDRLDNDNDGLIDSGDSLCGTGNWNIDVEFDESGIYF